MPQDDKQIFIIDDSALMRKQLAEFIDGQAGLAVAGSASNPVFAARKLKTLIPDAITLDIEMPKMDGVSFLRVLMSQHPVPVIVLSSLTPTGSRLAVEALQLGACSVLDKSVIFKPDGTGKHQLTRALAEATAARVRKKSIGQVRKITHVKPSKKLTADVVLKKQKVKLYATTDKVIAIGASTGGTEAIRFLLENLPEDSPGIVVAQHMPPGFTRSFAERLNSICKIQVREAKEGDRIHSGLALIAPGDQHLMIRRSGAMYYANLKAGPPVNRHIPSVNVLFRSAAQNAQKNVLAVLLTGMGDDGAQGLLEIKQAGGQTIAQDEASSVVFGMPKEAIKLGAAQRVLSLQHIADALLKK